jgi:serine phosphatase RsbU (regulator of sigma subunit)
MAVARSLFRVYASADVEPSDVLNRINRDLVASSHSGMFVTALYAVIDTASGRARVSAAGHPPALVIRTKTGAVDSARPPGVPLGIMAEATFSDIELPLDLDDRLVLYTDGVTEASTSNGDQFGPDRLRAFLWESAPLSSMDLVRALEDRLRAFAGETGQSDDIAAVAITRVRAIV